MGTVAAEGSARKIIIDTDPGIDDAITLFAAMKCKEVEVIGITTIFGNVPTAKATENALSLLEFMDRADVPVSPGSPCTFTGEAKPRIADFVHGNDGMGNTNALSPPTTKPISTPGHRFIIDKANEFPGEVTILALGPLTNLALAFKEEPATAQKLKSIVLLGGAFKVNGNVGPQAEANIFSDPDAADAVFGSSANIFVVPLDITTQCFFSSSDLDDLEAKGGEHGKFLKEISQFYAQFHTRVYGSDAIMLHDPAAFLAIVRPELFWWKGGKVRVCCEGLLRGMTVMDENKKQWVGDNAWSGRKTMHVALQADESAVVRGVKNLLIEGE